MRNHVFVGDTLCGARRTAPSVHVEDHTAHAPEPRRARRSGLRVAIIEPRGGASLQTLLARRKSGTVLLGHLLCAMRGAAALHKRGVVHGDIRPENIFFVLTPHGSEPMAKLLHLPGELEPARARAYRAPEQRAGWLLDPRTDVYGFGVVLHELLTGRLPKDLYAPPRADAKPSLDPDSDHVPAGLTRLVRRALQPDPALRPNSVTTLMAAIEPYTRHPALRAPLPLCPRPVERAAARQSLSARLSAVFALGRK